MSLNDICGVCGTEFTHFEIKQLNRPEEPITIGHVWGCPKCLLPKIDIPLHFKKIPKAEYADYPPSTYEEEYDE